MQRFALVGVLLIVVAACAGAQAETAELPAVANAASTSEVSTSAMAQRLPTTATTSAAAPATTTTVVTSVALTTTTTTTAAPITATTAAPTTTTTAVPTTTTAAPTTTAPPTTTTTTAPPTTTTAPPTTTTTTAAPLNGAAIFAANCVICHGANGEGGYGANLQLSSLTRRQIITTVTNGRGAMESFAEILTPEEIEAVAKYVKKLQIG